MSGLGRFPNLGFVPRARAPVADYARSHHAQQYRELAAACDAGECEYAVVPGAPPRPKRPGQCDGWRGTVWHETVGPVLRVRRCDRFRAYERGQEREPKKGGVGKSWRGDS